MMVNVRSIDNIKYIETFPQNGLIIDIYLISTSSNLNRSEYSELNQRTGLQLISLIS